MHAEQSPQLMRGPLGANTMDPRKLFYDDRLKGHCVYCGGSEETRDHVPSKVLLDEPYPEDLPVVPACLECNNGFSLDEEYLACFLECVLCGTVDPRALKRDRIRRKLQDNPNLLALIAAAAPMDPTRHQSGSRKRVVLKMSS